MKNRPLLPYIILVVLALIWGSSFILMKRGLETYSSEQVAAIRMVVAFLCLFPFIAAHLRKVQPKEWKYIIATGLLGNGIPAFLFTKAETGISSSLAGMLNSLTPLFTLIVGFFLYKTKMRPLNILGVLIGFAGTAGLMMAASGGKMGGGLFYALLVVLATICYAFSVNIIKSNLYRIDSILLAGFALLAVGPICGIYLFSTDFVAKTFSGGKALADLGYVVVLGMFGTAISLVYFNKLIKMTNALFAASCTYLIPIVAVMWGLADNEKLGIFHLGGLIAILAGVYLINKKVE